MTKGLYDDEMGRQRDERLARLRSGRGNGAWRTFHCRPTPVKTRAGIQSALEYQGGDRADLVEEGGNVTADDLGQIGAALDANRRTRDRDTLAVKGNFELDRRLSRAQQIEVARELERQLSAEGYAIRWAIHDHRKGVQPHLHFVVTKRRAWRAADGGWQVDAQGRKGARIDKLFMRDRAGLRAFRQQIADAMNAQLAAAGIAEDFWHPGSFREIGIQREPKKRIPPALWHAGVRELDAGVVAAKHRYHQARRDAGKVRSDAKRAAKAQRDRDHRNRDPEVQRMKLQNERAARILTGDEPRPPSVRQEKLIIDLARECGVTLPDNWRSGDAGEWIGGLRATKMFLERDRAAATAEVPKASGPERLEPKKISTRVVKPKAEVLPPAESMPARPLQVEPLKVMDGQDIAMLCGAMKHRTDETIIAMIAATDHAAKALRQKREKKASDMINAERFERGAQLLRQEAQQRGLGVLAADMVRPGRSGKNGHRER
ncbi:MAG: MobA/MobL family protein [Ferrovibrio sp.]|uniref:MobA/MobL family protein n=1 Tax=Ferrovibrio sp. TaxID=1917215 RepID=UPI003918ED27